MRNTGELFVDVQERFAQDGDVFSQAVLPTRENITHVLPAVFHSVGLTINDSSVSTAQSKDVLNIPEAKQAIVILVDGLGFEQLQHRRGHVPNLRAFGIDRSITTVAPSTTAAAITAFGTGMLPGKTATPGYSLRSPYTWQRFNLINWEGAGVLPQQWQQVPTLCERLDEDDAESVVLIQPRKFIGSGLTNAALRGARSVAAESLHARVEAAAEQLRNGARVCYLYWGDIDKVGHHYGWQSDPWVAELEHFDKEFGHLLRILPRGVSVIVTADHGMVDAGEKIDLANRPELMHDIESLAGEERATHIYTHNPEGVAMRWRSELGDLMWIATKHDINTAQLFGDLTPFTQKVMGDVVCFARTSRGIVHSGRDTTGALQLVGVHGSLTESEMRIPLLVGIA